MRLSSNEIGCIAVGIAGVALIAYFAHLSVDDNGKPQPRYEGEIASAGFFNAAADAIDTGDHYFHPYMCARNQRVVFLPHRYPTVSGSNITTLIHRGLTPLNKPAPQDSDWMEQPPGNVMW